MLTSENLTATMNSNPVFSNIDIEVNNFYILIKEKNIEPKELKDLQRIDILFQQTIKNVKILIDSSPYPDEMKKIIYSRFVIDMYGKLHETFNLPFELIPENFGPASVRQFKEVSKSIGF